MKQAWKYTVPTAVTVALVGLTLVSGYVHGKLTNRFGEPADLVAAANRLESLPKQFGDWRMEKSEELGDVAESMLECAGYVNGRWVNQVTGETVDGFIVLGPPGPISVHTPEICYSSRDFDVREKRARVAIGGENGGDDFWALTFRSTDVNANLLRVYYAWTSTDRWEAPKNPRFQFGGRPLLFKMQLAAYLPPDTNLEAGDTCQRFLEEFLPVVRSVLVPQNEG